MQIMVNGEQRDVTERITVAELLTSLNLRRDGTAVEVNREIVPRARHGELRLKMGDAVEIVTFVGGG